MRYFWQLEFILEIAAAASPACTDSLTAMLSDINFISANNTVFETCYVQYQNDRYAKSSGKSVCAPWEFGALCVDYLNGRTCVASNDFVEMSVCVPQQCGESELEYVNMQVFQTDKTTIDCSTEPSSPLVPALVSTVVVLLVTVVLVFALRPPSSVRESLRVGKAEKLMSSITSEFK